MTKEYRAKVFKSGNSLALRLPKALGLKEGAVMRVREEQQGFIVEPTKPAGRIDVSGFAGKCPWLEPLAPDLRDFDDRPSAGAHRPAPGKR